MCGLALRAVAVGRTSLSIPTAVAALIAACAPAWAADQGNATPPRQSAAGSTAAPGASGPPVANNTAEADTGGLSEVVVTARYRGETVQKSPLSVTAISSDLIQKQGLQTVADVAMNAPNVVLNSGSDQGGGLAVAAVIRGVGQTGFLFAESPGVGFYLDDVYFGTLFGSDFDLGDVDRVEILRGPQGTLFGRNSEGGAIRVFTKDATGDGSGMIEAGYGSRDHYRVSGNFDTTIIPEKLFIRFSGGSDAQNGYVSDVDFACRNPGLAGPNLKIATTSPNCQLGELGGTNVQTARVAIRALPTDALTIDLKISGHRENDEPAAVRAIAVKTPADGIDPLSGVPYAASGKAYFNGVLIPTYGFAPNKAYLGAGRYESYETFYDARTGIQYPDYSQLNSAGSSLNVEWKQPFATITSITGWQWYYGRAGDEPPVGPLPIAFTDVLYEHHQISEELRIGSIQPIGALNLEWTAGGYYYNENDIEGGNVANEFIQQAFTKNNPVHDQVESPFAHGVLHLTDKLSIEGGWRLTHEVKSYTFVSDYIELGGKLLVGEGVPRFPGIPPTTTARINGRSDYKGNITYEITPDIMVYATTATGFKSGGVNPTPTVASQVIPFGPETLTSYEVGLRTEWFDRRLRINPTYYFNDYQGLQRSAAVTNPLGEPFSAITNVGKVHIQGLELEGAVSVFKGFDIDFSGSYLDYKTVSLGGATGINPDIRPPLVPGWDGHVGAEYTFFDAFNHGSVSARFDYHFQSYIFFDQLGSLDTREGGYGLLNGALTWNSQDRTWQIKLDGKNLTNKYYYSFETNYDVTHGVSDGVVGRPREYLISVRRNF
jgi:iron complex outermembrane receptor protein